MKVDFYYDEDFTGHMRSKEYELEFYDDGFYILKTKNRLKDGFCQGIFSNVFISQYTLC